MGMTEVAYECRDVASYMVASQELEPGSGWPWDDVLRHIRSNPDITPEEEAKAIPGDYISSSGSDTTLSPVDLSKAGSVANALSAWAQEMKDHLDEGSVRGDLRNLITNADYYERGRWSPSDYKDYRDQVGFAQAVNKQHRRRQYRQPCPAGRQQRKCGGYDQ